MLRATAHALDVLAEMHEITGAQAGEGIYPFREDDGGAGFAVGAADENNQVAARGDQPVVIVAVELDEPLDGLVLDFTATADRGEFTLTRP